MAARNARNERLAAYAGAQAKLVSRLAGLGTPALGPDFNCLGGTALADALVAYRLGKHFRSDEVIDAKQRRDRTIAAMLEYDSNGITSFDYRQLPQPLRGQVLQVRESLHKFFKGMKRSHCFRAPTGETAEASGGFVDLMAKLLDEEQWRVSIEAASEAAAVAYHNTMLKREVKRRFRAKFPKTWRSVLRRRYAEVNSQPGSPGWKIFRFMFLNCCIIQNYSRLSTVLKNATTDRTISMEPLWNMVAQLSFARDLRAHLFVVYGINLDRLAELHRTLIRHAVKATIDFSNASNSNWVAVLRFLLPPKVCDKLLELRTPVCFYKGRFHYYNMLAPMGCGFTFEVMTIILLHIGRIFDPGASVFGDDVIIDATKAADFIALASCMGWRINTSKTFIEGNFRESCGGFHDLSTGRDIHSYEMHAIEDDFDACTTANKLYRILEKRQISPDLRQVLYSCYSSLLSRLPRDVMRSPDEVWEELPSGVVISDEDVTSDYQANQVSRLASLQLHTKMRMGRAFAYTLEKLDLGPVPPNIELAAYLYRGGSYTPTRRGSDRLIKETVYAKGNGRLATVPLLSFI